MVRTLFSAISHGTEMLVYRGEVPKNLGLDLTIPTMEGRYEFPIKYGYSNVGRVVEVGDRDSTFKPGDMVFVHAPHETCYCIPGHLATLLPHEVPPKRGIFVANLETAINSMLDSGVHFGENVVIFGQGVVGLLLTILSKRAGVHRILTVDRFEKRRELSLYWGADFSFDPEADGLEESIMTHTKGVGSDVVIEASGNPEALNTALQIAAFQGTVVVVSWYGERQAELSLGDAFHRNRLIIKSSQVSNIDSALTARWNPQRRMDLALELLKEIPLEHLISHVYHFREAGKAFDKIDRHPEEVVQVVLEYGKL
jgi:2-desacetyl-2-hydroxyethyl bacteriochlorophyllide A dehydrogenase